MQQFGSLQLYPHIHLFVAHWFSIFGNMHTALAHSLWYTPKQMQSHLHHDSFFPHCTQSPSSKLTQSFYPAVTSCHIIYIIAWSPLKHSEINWVSTVLCKVWAIVSINSWASWFIQWYFITHSEIYNVFYGKRCKTSWCIQSVNSEIYTSP